MVFRVAEPYVDLRSTRSVKKGTRGKDRAQLSQILYGDRVDVLGTKDEWLYVSVPDQERYLGEQWEGYRGWIPASSLVEVKDTSHSQFVLLRTLESSVTPSKGKALKLGLGVRLPMIREEKSHFIVSLPSGEEASVAKAEAYLLQDQQVVDREMVDFAKIFLGIPYAWGGLSTFERKKGEPWGIDCSGMVYLLHRAFGIAVPRDATDLYQHSLKVECLQPGDLVFFAHPNTPKRMVHVLLYAGKGKLLEATSITGNVRMTTFEEYLGKAVQEVVSGEIQMIQETGDERIFFFGSFFRNHLLDKKCLTTVC